MPRLKYPIDLNEVGTDYITFAHFPFKLNRSLPGAGAGRVYSDGFNADPPANTDYNVISLYVPNSIPAMNQQNNYNAETAPGELGQLKRSLAATAAGAAYSDNPIDAAAKVADALSQALSVDGMGTGISALRQSVIEATSRRLGQNPNSIIALSSGKILNPNVEVVYQGPTLREFTFNFAFAAKTKEEADVVKDIIFEFKRWSAPGGPDKAGGMLEIPHLWRVKYKGIFEKNVNPFKRAVLKSVNVDYNSGLNTHMTFDDGEPIIIGLQLHFQETDYITRKDHETAREYGFMGGH